MFKSFDYKYLGENIGNGTHTHSQFASLVYVCYMCVCISGAQFTSCCIKGGNFTDSSYFYTFYVCMTVGALPVVKDTQTKWHPCNETTAKTLKMLIESRLFR